MKVIYIFGQMRHVKYLNFHAFFEAEDYLISEGWEKVINPARIDVEAGFDARLMPEDSDWSIFPQGLNKRDVIRRDTNVIIDECTAGYGLQGWPNSVGGFAEHALLKWVGCEIIYQ